MKLMSFPEISDLENGQQIPSLQGTVKKVFDQKSDIGQYGQWWLQNLILQDEHANELTVTWCCEDAFDAGVEGQLLHFEAGRDKKDQLAGIKREIRHKNGKKYESVKVDDRAKVKVINGQPAKTADIPKTEMTHDKIWDSMHGVKPNPDWPDAPATAPELPLARPNGNSGRTMLDERQRAIIRQHSQSMALEVLKLKVELKELTVEDLTPAKLRSLADYFDTDVLEASK